MIAARVLVAASAPPLSVAVRHALTDAPELEAVDVPGGEMELLLRAADGDAELVVLPMTARTLPVVAERLVDENPRLAVLAVDLERDEALLYRLRPETALIEHLAEQSLAAVLRRVARDAGP